VLSRRPPRSWDLNVANAIDGADRLGPAAGLPFAVKDQISVAGYPTRAGMPRSRDTSRSVTRWWSRVVAAGGIPFCMTSLPDMNVVDGLMHQISAHSESFGMQYRWLGWSRREWWYRSLPARKRPRLTFSSPGRA
jgi:hypothetical protein